MVEEVEEKGIEKRGDKPDTADRSTKFVDVKHSYMICTERKRHLPMGRSDNHHHHTNTHTHVRQPELQPETKRLHVGQRLKHGDRAYKP